MVLHIPEYSHLKMTQNEPFFIELVMNSEVNILYLLLSDMMIYLPFPR